MDDAEAMRKSTAYDNLHKATARLVKKYLI